MPRARGGRSVTTLPPMSTSPWVGSSSPAIIRSRVDLPEPEGPRKTRNSPSRVARSTSLTAPSSAFRKIFVSPRVWTVAIPRPARSAAADALAGPLLEDPAELAVGGLRRVLGRHLVPRHLREHGGQHEGVERLVDGRGGVPRVADVGRPLEDVAEHRVLVGRLRLGVVP